MSAIASATIPVRDMVIGTARNISAPATAAHWRIGRVGANRPMWTAYGSIIAMTVMNSM